MVVLTVKPTEDCNSACRYCYSRKRPGRMSPQVLEVLYARISEYLVAHPEETLEILWHGGEPLLAGLNFFSAALALQKKYFASRGGRVRYGLQSNLTLLSEGIVGILKEMGIRSVGTSFDPEDGIRGPHKGTDSDRYKRDFIHGLSALERNGLSFGINYVVTQKSLARPLDVFYFLTNLSPPGAVFLNPVLLLDGKERDLGVSPAEYLRFLGAIFPQWWKNRNRYPGVQPFAALGERLLGKKIESGCMDFGACNSSSQHLEITPQGDILQSGYSGKMEMPCYGNIQRQSLEEILQSDERKEFLQTIEGLKNRGCKGCRFWNLCHEVPSSSGSSAGSSLMFKTEWCETRIRFIEEYFEPLTGVRFESQRL
ncbi:MAG: radical SAM protein [Syntrophaceae bacterium]|nr:radical SAM protein [Syntrophaceae bacterium]